LKNSSEFRDEVWEEFYKPNHYAVGLKLPWFSTFQKLRFRSSEVTIWTGFNGAGKSQILGQIFSDFISQQERVCIASMEMKPRKLLKRMYRQVTCSEMPDQDTFEKCNRWLSNGLWVFNVKGRAKTESIFKVFKYARMRYGVRQFLIDSLAKCGIGEDDYQAQKTFIEDCCDISEELDSHIHIVAHSRKK
jgi:twinkle protein